MKFEKIILVLALVFLHSFISFSQIGNDIEKRKNKANKNPYSEFGDRGAAIYSHSRSHYRPFGWHVSPGLTYMVGNTKEDNNADFNLKPSGLPGYYLEIGLAHIFKQGRKIFHYYDYGIGVKHYGGTEKFENGLGYEARGFFNFGSAFGRIDLHSVIQLSRWNFIDQSLGANLDYRIYGGNSDSNYGTPLVQDYQEKLVGQFHYSIGWGIKPRDGFFIIPTVQTPILTAYNFRGLNPGHTWFSSKYQPLIFTVKIGFLFVKRNCPDVYDPNGKNQQDGYDNR